MRLGVAQAEEVGGEEVLVGLLEGAVGVGFGAEVGDGVVDCVEGGVFAWSFELVSGDGVIEESLERGGYYA